MLCVMSAPVRPILPVPVPDELPFLASLSWFDAGYRDLSPLEMLARYEKGIRLAGVTAELSGEERAFVRALARAYGSVLDGEL